MRRSTPMKKYLTLIEGVILGIGGLIVSVLGWVDDSLKWILIALSVAVLIASVALFYFQHTRDKAGDTAE